MFNQRAIIACILLAASLICMRADAREIQVVSTNSILADLVKNVSGEWIKQTVLVGANGDPHTFEPTPQDNVVLKNADVIFENGLHLEPWLDSLYGSSGSQADRYRITEGLDLIQTQGETDPHVWHDVENVMAMVKNIRDALMKEDPEHAGVFQKNADIYLSKLSALDAWMIKEVANVPQDRRQLVTSHDTFGYFARRYGFEVIAAVIDSATTETADPSAAKIARLVETIKKTKVPAIFIENTTNPNMVKAVALETGVKISPPLYSDALGEKGSDGEDYIKMTEYNVRTIVEALR